MFYALWHTEEVNPPSIATEEKKAENIADEVIISKSTLPVPPASGETYLQAKDEELMHQEVEKEAGVSNLTPQQIQTQTEAVYEALTPENYEETMEEASINFDTLDEHVEKIEFEIAQEEEDRGDMDISELNDTELFNQQLMIDKIEEVNEEEIPIIEE